MQRDNAIIQKLGGHSRNVMTAITAQTPTRVVHIAPLEPSLVREQWACCLYDSCIDGIKIGVLTDGLIACVADMLASQQWTIPIVLDPVFKATSGAVFLSHVAQWRTHFLPLATCLTPNRSEAERLTNMTIKNDVDAEQAALSLRSHNPELDIIITDGDRDEHCVTDVVLSRHVPRAHIDKRQKIRIGQDVSHGSGCAFSAALTFYLARGFPLIQAHRQAVYQLESDLRGA